MFEKPTYKVQIEIVNPETITFSAVAQNPRIYRPQDLLAASQNLKISTLGTQPLVSVTVLAKFLTSNFFVLAHRTGLYNRQRALWESLAKVTTVEVHQASHGLIHKSLLPIFYLVLLDWRGKPMVLACLDDFPIQATNERHFSKLLTQLCRKAGKMSGLSGLFLCRPQPFPETVIQKIAKLTNACDPIGRYDSLLPDPLSIPINLLEINSPDPSTTRLTDNSCDVRLVHPDLTTAKRDWTK
ncbi:MAG: hypothetical protein HY711_08460 [Candidatus Melainabacteria bacterium]|nr:hypothetical protein [Candidatus Melainabacteria bacterium]